MGRLFLKENQLADYELVVQKTATDNFYTDIVIYFVLEGRMSIQINGQEYALAQRDFIAVNPCCYHSWQIEAHSLIAFFMINVHELEKYYNLEKIWFNCYSKIEPMEFHTSFRALLDACIGKYYGKKAADGRTMLRLNGIYFQLVDALITNYSVPVKHKEREDAVSEDEGRINRILNYIHMNFRQTITLASLADQFFMSTAYLSRYFKKETGKNFGEYLTEVRLDFAVLELESTDKSIVRIALDNGFANVSSFNKAFKEKYQMAPKKYQEQHMLKTRSVKEELDAAALEHRLKDYYESGQSEEKCSHYEKPLIVDACDYKIIAPSWNKMINIGRISSLLRSDIQEHTLILKRELNIQYIRMWDLYDEELMMHTAAQGERYNFSKLDKVLDFLTANQLHPFLELAFKPIVLLDDRDSFIRYVEREILFKDLESIREFLLAMMHHVINRYGMPEVSQWYFECWSDPRLIEKDNYERYFDIFETTYSVIKNIAPGVHIGGAYDREYDVMTFDDMIHHWVDREIQPDFISIYCYQTRYKEYDLNMMELSNRKLTRKNFLADYLSEQKKSMDRYGMNVPVIVGEWNMTVANRNILNDSCYKGAYVMRSLMNMYPQAQMLGYWFGTDLFVEYEEAPKLLDGCGGLLSYHGIRKPAFYAVDFMNRLGNYLLGKNENIMVTMDGYDNYMIACHNYKEQDAQYHLRDERELTIENIPLVFEDHSRLNTRVQIRHVKNGSYYVKVRKINQKYGSIQDEWYQMGQLEELNTSDIKYLNNISVPHITIYKYEVENELLDIPIILEPHEIQYIHIFRQM